MPKLSLSFDLHLHHSGVSFLNVVKRLFNPWEQVDNLLLAE